MNKSSTQEMSLEEKIASIMAAAKPNASGLLNLAPSSRISTSTSLPNLQEIQSSRADDKSAATVPKVAPRDLIDEDDETSSAATEEGETMKDNPIESNTVSSSLPLRIGSFSEAKRGARIVKPTKAPVDVNDAKVDPESRNNSDSVVNDTPILSDLTPNEKSVAHLVDSGVPKPSLSASKSRRQYLAAQGNEADVNSFFHNLLSKNTLESKTKEVSAKPVVMSFQECADATKGTQNQSVDVEEMKSPGGTDSTAPLRPMTPMQLDRTPAIKSMSNPDGDLATIPTLQASSASRKAAATSFGSPVQQDPSSVSPIAGGLMTKLHVRSISRERPRQPEKNSDRAKSHERGSRLPAAGTNGINDTHAAFTPQHRRLPASATVGANPDQKSSGPDATDPQPVPVMEPWSLARRPVVQSEVPSSSMKKTSLGLTVSTAMGSHGGPGAGAVKVAVRVRPFTNGEIQNGARRIVSCSEDKLVVVNPSAFDADPDTIVAAAAAVHCKEWAQVFKFNHCLWSYDPNDTEDEYIDQEGVHRAIGSEIVENILNGVSASCFAYGHTGTGKTHSLFGSLSPPTQSNDMYQKRYQFEDEPEDDDNEQFSLTEFSGLIPRLLWDTITGIKQRDGASEDTRITLSFMEVYNEKLRDLLSESTDDLNLHDNSATLRVREHPQLGPYVEGLTKAAISSPEDALRLLYEGHARRAIATTAWNPHSSRSHAFVVLELSPAKVELTTAGLSKVLFAPVVPAGGKVPRPVSGSTGQVIIREDEQLFVRLQVVDLAGSEKDSMVKEEEQEREGQRSGRRSSTASMLSPKTDSSVEKTEMKMIRRSLSTLGYIIKALGKGASCKTLPYRDSVLTWLMRDGLNGRNHTTMLATLSPAHGCYEETLSTLKYAARLCLVGTRSYQFGEPTFAEKGSVSVGKSALTQDFMKSTINDEFARIHQGLGASKPGTKASRQLLKQTLSDPQQRLAKLNSFATGESDPTMLPSMGSAHHLSAVSRGILGGQSDYSGGSGSGSITAADSAVGSSQGLRDAYRQAQGRVVELQIELESARTDRDSMMVELQALRDALESAQLRGSSSHAVASEFTAAAKAFEKEVSDLKGVIARKDDMIDRLLADLAEEKKAKDAAEASFTIQVNEFLSRLEEQRRESVAVIGELDRLRSNEEVFVQERELYQNEIDQLRDANVAFNESNGQLHTDIRLTEAAVQAARSEIAELQQMNALADASIAEKTRLLERLQAEHSVLVSERDSLASLCDHQAKSLKLQSQQSEASLKMLQQRQSALERIEKEATINLDDWDSLQEGLKGMLAQEGSLLHSELLDAKRLTGMIASMRERAQEAALLQEELVKERAARQQLQLQLERRGDDSFRSAADLASDKVHKQLIDQVNYYRKSAEASEARAQYWQQVAQKVKSRGGDVDQSAEVLQLRDQLAAAQSDAASAKTELLNAQENMQKEFASLWMAVQELNKLDASKERALAELISDREHAVREKDAAVLELGEYKQKYRDLQSELQAIDRDLLSAVETENISLNLGNRLQGPSANHSASRHPVERMQRRTVDRQGHTIGHTSASRYSASASADPIPQRRNSQHIEDSRKVSSDASSHRSLPADSEEDREAIGYYRQSGPLAMTAPAGSPGIEKVLQNQILELSGFLDEDRDRLYNQQKRTQARSQSRGRNVASIGR